MTKELSFLNLFESKKKADEVRKQVEAGLQAFNSIQNACEIIDGAVRNVDAIQSHLSDDSVKLHFNPYIGLLSDFVQHCKLLVSVNGIETKPIVAEVNAAFKALISDSRFQSDLYKEVTVEEAPIDNFGSQISLVLRIGEVFNVPVFTVYVMRDVFNNASAAFDSDESVGVEFTYNAKQIAKYSRLDVMLELLLHATRPDPYDEVNVLIAHSINDTIVSKFADTNPNAVIEAECAKFFALLLNDTVTPLLIKPVLIAIIQNPAIKTADDKRFSDMFPSGQYVKYFGEVAYRATTNPEYQGPIMLPGVQAEPLTRTDIIVAALTAANAAMGADANIVAAGGAAVSYYIKDFVKGMNAGEFGDVIAETGLDVNALEALKKGCDNIPMNDIDCFVFGEVSRQFLLLFSLYMMILYANFYERPKRYGVIYEQVTRIQFNLSPPTSSGNSDIIELFMYGNHNDDANTKLISKRLKKNPKVQLVTQEAKFISQLANEMCGSSSEKCTEDGYYMQPIDLVKKETDDFVVLYESLYPEGLDKPDLKALLESQYSKGADNMVSMKTTMLDLICIFCNEDKALFIRIFMARKNPKDFARLRVFIEMYLLQLLRKNDAAFVTVKSDLIREIKSLRVMMTQLNETYYEKQGNIAAFNVATEEKLNADRTAFLQLLRSIGRKIVLIPDPLDNAIPATFRKETGMRTIQFFNDPQNAQIKYPFDMSQHVRNLYETFVSVPIDTSTQSEINQAYAAWLSGVFNEILFTPKSEAFFRTKLGKILDKAQDPIYFEIGFDDMPVRSPFMLQLLDALKGVQYNAAFVLRFRPILSQLLKPLKKHIADNKSKPTAIYVGVRTQPNGLYDATTKALFPVFVKALLLGNAKMEGGLNSKTKELIEQLDDFTFDDAVNEEIGRIILTYDANVDNKRLAGGSTQKRKRVGKLNARTRSKTRLTNAKKSRKKRKANKLQFNRSRRA